MENAEKIAALRDMVNASIDQGGRNTEADIDRALDETEEELIREGY